MPLVQVANNEIAVYRKKVEAFHWECSDCKEWASLEHNNPECHTCWDWGGCNNDCTLSAIICPVCNARLDL